jgi:hypothetical protein
MRRELESLFAELPEYPSRASQLFAGLGCRERIAEAAASFGLQPFLVHHLPSQLSLSRQAEYSAKFRYARLERVLLYVTLALEEAGVQSIALKGPALAARLYPEPWMRPSSDLDMLVRRAELAKALETLEGLGFKLDRKIAEVGSQAGHHVCVVGERTLVELHFTTAGRFRFVSRLDVDALFERATRTELGGSSVSVLEPVDELIHLCSHAFDHAFQGLKWLLDLKLFVLAYRIDWREVLARARAIGITAPVGIALREARALGALVPQWVIESMRVSAVRSALPHLLSRCESRTWFAWVSELLLAERPSFRWGLRLVTPGAVLAAEALGMSKPVNALLNVASDAAGIEPVLPERDSGRAHRRTLSRMTRGGGS